MAYDDEKYVRASLDLASGVHSLRDVGISEDDIREMVDQALEEWVPE